ncbi:MAG: hypothetical protein Q9216_002623 [Gyalolechia sp. 2 TL-2023]
MILVTASSLLLIFVRVLLLYLATHIPQRFANGKTFQYIYPDKLLARFEQYKHALLYLFAGAQTIEKAYEQAQGGSFSIQTPGKQHVMVTSKAHIRELGQAPPGQLSLHAVAKEFLQPRHTMAGFDWRNQRGSDGTVFVRALRSLGTVNLPKILPHIKSGIADQIWRDLEGLPCAHAQNKAFLEAAMNVSDEVFIGAEFFRLLPESIAGTRMMFDMLLPLIEHRRKPCKAGNPLTAATYAVLDLYGHPENIEPLREELQGPAFADFMAAGQGLPLMDSFLQESMRLSMTDSTSVQRKALADFTFSDGLKVLKGDWVCVPWRAMMRDPQRFDNPSTFSASRFLSSFGTARQANISTRPGQLTDSGEHWLSWGTGRIRW